MRLSQRQCYVGNGLASSVSAVRLLDFKATIRVCSCRLFQTPFLNSIIRILGSRHGARCVEQL
jgi:hypothetical protein